MQRVLHVQANDSIYWAAEQATGLSRIATVSPWYNRVSRVLRDVWLPDVLFVASPTFIIFF